MGESRGNGEGFLPELRGREWTGEETMRLIDADALSERVYFCINNSKELVTSSVVRKAVVSLIDTQPAIEAEPVKHGRWWFEEYPDGYYHWECSHCGKQYSEGTMEAGKEYSYCPNCGAKMDGGGDGER